jgi:hypothetical protein
VPRQTANEFEENGLDHPAREPPTKKKKSVDKGMQDVAHAGNRRV